MLSSSFAECNFLSKRYEASVPTQNQMDNASSTLESQASYSSGSTFSSYSTHTDSLVHLVFHIICWNYKHPPFSHFHWDFKKLIKVCVCINSAWWLVDFFDQSIWKHLKRLYNVHTWHMYVCIMHTYFCLILLWVLCGYKKYIAAHCCILMRLKYIIIKSHLSGFLIWNL